MNRRLKILFLANRNPYPVRDGQTRRTYNIIKGLGKKNDVHLLSLYETKKEIEPENLRQLKSFCKHVEMYPAPPKHFSVLMLYHLIRSFFSFDPYTIWRHYSRLYVKKFNELVRTHEYDLIHCDILPLVYLVRNKRKNPCALTDHDASFLKALSMAKNSKNLILKGILYLEAYKLKKLESKVFEQVDIGIVVSSDDKRQLKKICVKGNFHVVENGVDTEEFKPKPDKHDTNTLVWTGGFDHYPNKEAIIFFIHDIYPLIKRKVPDVKLNIVGGGVTPKIKKLSDVDTSINFLGYVDDPIPYIQEATIFVVPLLSGGGTKLKTLEAMSTGKPIVTTTVGCEGIEGQDKVHYLVADEPEKFASAVINVLNDKTLQKYVGGNARKLAKMKYDWRIISEKLNKIYNSLVEEGKECQNSTPLTNPIGIK